MGVELVIIVVQKEKAYENAQNYKQNKLPYHFYLAVTCDLYL